MKNGNRTYTVQQLADIAGVSVRTLHHYHEIGLLIPTGRTESGYRLYSDKELLRLQQILFYRELDIPLKQIARIISSEGFNVSEALLDHHKVLLARVARLQVLLTTIEHTIRLVEEEHMPVDPKDLYEGFTPEEIENMETYVDENYDADVVAESRRNVVRMSKADFARVKQEGEAVARDIAEYMHLGPTHADVQALIRRHHAWIENFYTCSATVYEGLGDLYATNPDFTVYYDKYRPGLAEFMRLAMKFFARTEL